MRTTSRSLLTLLAALSFLPWLPGASLSAGAQVYTAGDLVENFTLRNRRTGQPMNLADFAGKIVFIDFFAHWCPVCNAAAPQLEEGVYKYFAGRGNAAGLPVIYVLANLQGDTSQRDIDGTARFISRFGEDAVVLEDNNRALQRRFTSQSGQPTFAIINGVAGSPSHRQWELVYSLHGYTSPGRVQPVSEFQNAINSVQAPSSSEPVIIEVGPQSQMVNVGASATFAVEARGTPPLSYQWLRNGDLIPGATAPILTLASVTMADAGQYSVRVSNGAGSETSAVATLVVVTPPPLPTPVRFVEQPRDQSVDMGVTVTFTVQVEGSAPFAFQWLKNDRSVAGATLSTLTLTAASSSDAGIYAVDVTNPAGTVRSDSARLTVITPLPIDPVQITRHPEGQTVTTGGTVRFVVEATGTPPLLYQWLRNGQPLPRSEGAELVIDSANATHAGQYFVRVRNAAGAVTSASGTLTVVAPPPIEPVRITSAQLGESGLRVDWIGGKAAFKVQSRESLDAPWSESGIVTSEKSVTIPFERMAAFFRVVSE